MMHKIRAMSAREIAYRGRTAFRVQLDHARILFRRNRHPRPKVAARYLTRDYLTAEPSRRFFVPVVRQDILGLVHANFPEWISDAVAQADRVCGHRIQVLGHGEILLPSRIDWTANPVTGDRWPSKYWADYDLVRQCGAGDPKVVHEINRHRHLIALGRAYFYTGDERYSGEAIAQLESWIEQNPEGIGINWHSSLEIAIRALSWLWTIFLLLPSRQFDDRRVERIMPTLFAHFAHIYRYPSVYSSPNTHLLGEAAALYAGGTIFSELKEGRKWRTLGESILIREARRQVLEDGFHSELSLYYHSYALEFYLTAMALARHNKTDFPESVQQRIETMLDALLHVARPDGSIPLLSDDDGGQATGLCRTGYRDVRHLLSTGAVLFARSDFKWRSHHFHEETLFLLGREGYGGFERLDSQSPRCMDRLFPNAGYFAGRSGWDNTDDHVLFDFGGLGFSGGGHGHADALSVVMSSGNEELLVDSGTGIYNTAPKWRNYFRSTRAHNTVVIDGTDQAEPSGTFQWKNSFNSLLLRHFASPGWSYVEAEHDAYRRLGREVTHRRRLLRVRPQCWVIADDFRGDGTHTFDSYFHFSPDAKVVTVPGTSRTSAHVHANNGECGLRLSFFASANVIADVVHGLADPLQGWISDTYGNIRSAPVLCATVHDTVPSASMTVLITERAEIDEEDSTSLSQLPIEGSPGTACIVNHRGRQDLFVMSLRNTGIRVAEFELFGEFFWIRSFESEARELFCINARYAAIGSRILFESPAPVSYTNVHITPDRVTTVFRGIEDTAYVCH